VADDVQMLRISNEGYHGPEGLEAFREIFGRAILGIEINPHDGHPLRFDMAIRATPDVAVAAGALSPMTNHHPSELATNDDLILVMMQEGTGELNHCRETVTVGAGEAVLTTNAEAGTFAGLTSTRLVNLRLRRDLLADREADLHAAVAKTITRDNFGLALLANYARVLADTNAVASDQARRVVSGHFYDLAALALGGSHDSGAHEKGVRAARLHAIKADIRDNLHRHDATLEDLARRQGISASYVRRLLGDDGTSYTDFVLEQRLVRARRLLLDARSSGRTISAIAFECGFGDLSYFNRVFRRRYGMTPSGMREAAR
jgi:AraC-like DNA-binding protein